MLMRQNGVKKRKVIVNLEDSAGQNM